VVLPFLIHTQTLTDKKREAKQNGDNNNNIGNNNSNSNRKDGIKDVGLRAVIELASLFGVEFQRTASLLSDSLKVCVCFALIEVLCVVL